jgi:glucosamine--fructose-6-phosphate aminotransferase (isomerizing)
MSDLRWLPARETGVVDQIEAAPEAVRRTLVESRVAADRAVALLRQTDVRRLFVIGNGTSFWSARWVSGWYRQLAAPDDPALIALSAASFRYYRPALASTDAVLAISASGEFRDVIASAIDLRGVIPVVGVVQDAASSLGAVAAEIVVAAGGPSPMPVMTRTFHSSATAAAMVAIGLLGDRQVAGSAVASLARGADAAESAISAARDAVPGLARDLRDYRHIVVFGGGSAALAAGEAALKLTEMALLHAEGSETWEVESGSATIIGPETAVIAIRPAGPAAAATAALARNSAGWGATVIEVSAERAVEGSALLSIPLDAPDDVAPLYAVPPLALLAYHLARSRGIDPDRPGWVGRYAAQGLHHVAGSATAGDQP